MTEPVAVLGKLPQRSAGALLFPTASVDTVATTRTLCSIAEPAAVCGR